MTNEDTPEAFMKRIAAITGKSVEELEAKCKEIGDRNAMDTTMRKSSIDIESQNKTARRVWHAPWKR